MRASINRVGPRHLAGTAVLYLPLAVLMFGGGPGSLDAVRRRCGGLAPFDVRAWWTTHEAQAMMTACGPSGRAAYLRQQLLDLAYPAALAAVLLVVTALLVRRWGVRWWPVLLPALLMTVLDYVENVGVWTLLLDWPDTHPAVLTLSAAATAAKRVLGFVAFSVPLVLGAARVGSWLARRRSGADTATA